MSSWRPLPYRRAVIFCEDVTGLNRWRKEKGRGWRMVRKGLLIYRLLPLESCPSFRGEHWQCASKSRSPLFVLMKRP